MTKGMAGQVKIATKKVKRRWFLLGILLGSLVTNGFWLASPLINGMYHYFFTEYEELIILYVDTVGPTGPGMLLIYNTGRVALVNVPTDLASMQFWMSVSERWPALCGWCTFNSDKPEQRKENLNENKPKGKAILLGWEQTKG